MQTSLARRQRRRRMGDRRRPRGSGAARAATVALPLFLFGTLLLLGLAGATGAVAAYSYFSRDLQDPKALLDALTFSQQTTVYDRTSEITLAKLGDDRRVLVTFDQIPPALVDATTSIEDKTFWENAGFDPLGFASAALDTLAGRDRGGSTITQQLVRARLLPASAFTGTVYERKVKEIIQSIRLTEAYPGQAGKEAIMAAYLNQNFYGNRSYGVAAAAQGYWHKNLKDLTLAQLAILAAIPQSPTEYDLVSNAVEETYTDANGKEQTHLVVPADSAVVIRRNFILDLMKTRSVLTKGQYTDADFEAAKAEPVILASQAAEQWKAPQFVYQVRDELGQILCGTAQCQAIDTGGYKVVTTLNYTMQSVVEKWLAAVAIAPNSSKPDAALTSLKIPKSEWTWLNKLRGNNVNNAAAGIIDYRTGDILAYAGSASYTAKASKKLQPQFDVLSDGWRQPGSSIKPFVYVTGLEDHTMTAATMFMDVVTNFAPAGATPYLPTQDDLRERGPVRMRNALQFSINVPAIKAGFINGLQHELDRFRTFGLTFPPGTIPVASESIGTLEVHPIDEISAYGALANNGVLVPHRTILKVFDSSGKQVWPATDAKPTGKRIVSADAAYIITDILAGNTITSVNPYWAKWQVTNGVASKTVRPAAYKTGTTTNAVDTLAYGYIAPPSDASQPALVAGVWLGNSDNTPIGVISLESSAPLWSAIMSDASQGLPIEGFSRVKPKTLVTATVDAFTGMLPGPLTTKTVKELFIPGTVPTKASNDTVTVDIDQASGLLWQDGCVGPKVATTFLDFSNAEPAFPSWEKSDMEWQARAARGAGVRGGPKRTLTGYFYGDYLNFYPFGRTWGGTFAPTATCPVAPPPPTQCISIDPFFPCPSPSALPSPGPLPSNPGNGGGPKPKPTPKP